MTKFLIILTWNQYLVIFYRICNTEASKLCIAISQNYINKLKYRLCIQFESYSFTLTINFGKLF